MRKRKPATALKHISKPKIVTKAQRAKQAVVRSPKNSDLRSATESSIKSRPDRHNDSSQRASLILSPATLTHDDSKQKTTVTDSKTEFVRSDEGGNTRRWGDFDTHVAFAMMIGFNLNILTTNAQRAVVPGPYLPATNVQHLMGAYVGRNHYMAVLS